MSLSKERAQRLVDIGARIAQFRSIPKNRLRIAKIPEKSRGEWVWTPEMVAKKASLTLKNNIGTEESIDIDKVAVIFDRWEGDKPLLSVVSGIMRSLLITFEDTPAEIIIEE